MNIQESIIDITEFPQDIVFDQFIKEIKEKYDAFLIDCFESCGFAKDYILEHSDEFNTVSCLTDNWTTYKWKGKPIFTIYNMRYYEESFGSPSGFFNKYEARIYAEIYLRNFPLRGHRAEMKPIDDASLLDIESINQIINPLEQKE